LRRGLAALIGEGGKHQAIDTIRLRLRERAGADRARGFTEDVIFRPSGFALQHVQAGSEVGDAACDIGIAQRHGRAAITFMVHGPHVEAVTGKDIHQRIFAFAGNGQVVARQRRQRGAMHQEQHRKRLRPCGRRADALSIHEQLHIALIGPIFTAPDITYGFCSLRPRWRCAANKARANSKTRACDQGASCDGMIVHDALSMLFS
jgi:hypothetical protein